jgi:hypothetical protein
MTPSLSKKKIIWYLKNRRTLIYKFIFSFRIKKSTKIWRIKIEFTNSLKLYQNKQIYEDWDFFEELQTESVSKIFVCLKSESECRPNSILVYSNEQPFSPPDLMLIHWKFNKIITLFAISNMKYCSNNNYY